MKTKHGLLTGFAVIAIAAMFTLAGCEDPNGGGGGVALRNELVGTWANTESSTSLTIHDNTFMQVGITYWTFVATDDKPAGTAGSTFTVARYGFV